MLEDNMKNASKRMQQPFTAARKGLFNESSEGQDKKRRKVVQKNGSS